MNPRILLHRLLFLLVTLLVFEGLIRKWLGGGAVGLMVFIAKDIICLAMLFLLGRCPSNVYYRQLSSKIGGFTLALMPLVLMTGAKDPVLGIFGAKQYLLWSVVALAAAAAYVPNYNKLFFRLLTWAAILVIPTTLVAAYQQRLPAGHWLNTTPDGVALIGFSAAGQLRVSGTFSFLAQYCMYLNALCFAIPAAMSQPAVNPFWKLLKSSWVLIPFFIAGSFITGSRGAVIGNTVIGGLGLLLLVVRGGGRAAGLAVGLTMIIAVSLLILRDSYPEFFAAYDARSEAVGGVSHAEMIVDRVATGLFGWTGGLPPKAPASMFGYGLGVMSNGSQRVSQYAASWRTEAFWTETDQSTTLFEGGFYLVVIWYGLRLFMIVTTVVWSMQIRTFRFLLPAAFASGFIVVVGLIGTLSMQAPYAIWWWLAVGSVACLHSFDVATRKRATSARQARSSHDSPTAHAAITETAGV